MTPAFYQDKISYHDCAEESYHLWGTSWMMQFGEVPTGGYFWRPAYINHGAFASEMGCIALGRVDSKLFNHFHYNPWTTQVENQDRFHSFTKGESIINDFFESIRSACTVAAVRGNYGFRAGVPKAGGQ